MRFTFLLLIVGSAFLSSATQAEIPYSEKLHKNRIRGGEALRNKENTQSYFILPSMGELARQKKLSSLPVTVNDAHYSEVTEGSEEIYAAHKKDVCEGIRAAKKYLEKKPEYEELKFKAHMKDGKEIEFFYPVYKIENIRFTSENKDSEDKEPFVCFVGKETPSDRAEGNPDCMEFCDTRTKRKPLPGTEIVPVKSEPAAKDDQIRGS